MEHAWVDQTNAVVREPDLLAAFGDAQRGSYLIIASLCAPVNSPKVLQLRVDRRSQHRQVRPTLARFHPSGVHSKEATIIILHLAEPCKALAARPFEGSFDNLMKIGYHIGRTFPFAKVHATAAYTFATLKCEID